MPRFVCTSDTKLQTDFARGATITAFGQYNAARTQIPINLCQECGDHRRGYGRIEVHSLLRKRRERTLEASSEVLEVLEVKEDRWFGRVADGSPKVKWMRRVYPRVDYTQAPWTVVMLS